MAPVRPEPAVPVRAWTALLFGALVLGGPWLLAQSPQRNGPSTSPAAKQQERPVVEVRVVGHNRVPIEKLTPHIRTRAGRLFNPETLEEDVRRLYATKLFVNIKPYVHQVDNGCVVIFEVIERPLLEYVKFVGNQSWGFSRKTLLKEADLKAGSPMDPFTVEQARSKLEEYYHSKGFAKVQVTVVEGNKTGDRGAIFLIDEGPKQRILWTKFEGNTVAADARLRTQIQSKPGIFWLFKGTLERQQLTEDAQRLTDYYRGLGFFQARVGRPLLDFNENQDWVTVTFVIDEGPRYQVRNVAVIGNAKFTSQQLTKDLKLRSGEYFNRATMTSDRVAMIDTYGTKGYVFADVSPDLRFPDELPGKLDLIYHITEGSRYRVGQINVEIKGPYPHTRISTVLNRISLQPGDIVDTRELRASERRLKASGLFKNDPGMGITPKIVFTPPDQEKSDHEREEAVTRRPRTPGGFRGQSPDPAEQVIDVTVQAESAYDENPGPWTQPGPLTPDPSWGRGEGKGERGEGSNAAPASQGADPASPLIIRGQSPDEPPMVEVQGRAASRSSETAGAAVGNPAQAPVEPAARSSQGSSTLNWSRPARTGQPTAAAGLVAQASGVPAPLTQAPSVPAGGAAAPWIVRGQYTADPGVSMPSMPSPSPGAGVQTGPLTSPSSGLPVSGGPYASQMQPGPLGLANSGTTPAGAVSGTPATGALGPALPIGPGLEPGSPAMNTLPPPDTPLYIPLNPTVEETETGRLMFSVGVNSEAGLIGSIVLDEQNFDWTRFPRSWEDIRNRTAWRGAGQRFRLEAMPGTQVQKYAATFQEPYLLDTQVSLSLSGFFYDRIYREWTEERLGGRIGLGYQFTHDLSGTIAYRGSKVTLFNPIIRGVPDLEQALGTSTLHGFQVALAHDTRDNPFLATEGHLIELSFEHVTGTFQYPRAGVDLRQYFLLRQHPDGSGRHVLSVGGRVGYTGEDTPIYEHYFAGGFSTIRGFRFRGASPVDTSTGLDVTVGGHFELLASVEYMFPITADDTLRGVVFLDTGTVEPTIDNWTNKYRVAPGFGLRITIPAMGPAPIALDLAFPVSQDRYDRLESFSFWIGFLR